MANKQKTVEIIFGAIDQTGSGIKSVGKNLSGLERNIGNVTTPLANVADSILKLDAVLATAAIGLTAYSIKLADDFGTSFAEIATLVGQPADSLEDFKNDIQTYAESSTASFEEITGATYNAISAGVDYADSLNVLEQAETLSIAGRADLDITTKALVSTLNAYGAEMDQAGAFSDTFFTIVQKGQTTLPELADTIGQVAPLAAQAGIKFEELGAAIAAVTAGAGVSTSEAMTALRATIASIIGPTEQSAKAAKAMGLDFNAAALESKGLKVFLEEVADATGGNIEKMRALFPNVRALTAVLPLTGSAASKFAGALDAMNEKQGIAQRSAIELRKDLEKLEQTLKNNVTSAFIALGDNFTEESIGIVESLSSIFNSIGSELKLDNGAFAPIIDQLDGVFKDIERKFKSVAENIPGALDGLDFSNLLRAFDGLGEELGENFRAIFGDVDIETVDGLEDALQTVVDAFTSLVDITAGITDGLQPLFELIGEGVNGFNDLSGETSKSIGQMLGLASAIDTILPAIGALGSGLSAVGNGLIAIAGVKALPILGQIGQLSTLAAGAGKFGLIGTALLGAGGAGAGVGYGLGAILNEIPQLFGEDTVGTLLYDWINGEETEEKLKQLEDEFKNAKQSAVDFAEGQKQAAEASKDVAEFVELDIELLNTNIATKLDAKKAQSELNEETEAGIEAQEKSAGTLSFVASETKKVSREMKKAAEDSEEFRLKLLEIASDERIATIEAKIELDIAQLEADTKTAVAVIETLGASIQSTGNLIGSLFGNLQDASGTKRFDIERQIALENELRQKAFDQQQKLTDAQIDLYRKKAAAIAKGDSLIKVSAEGLTPAIEMIFQEVLDYAQVRANQEGLDLLVGV